MEQHNSDRDIKRLFECNVPPVNTDEVWRGVRRKIDLRQKSPRPRSAWLRVALTATAAVLVVAAIGVGVLEAATHMGGGKTVIVIGGAETTVTAAAAATTSTAAASATTGQATTELAPLVGALRDAGVEPLGIEGDPSKPTSIIVKVAADKMAPPDGIFYSHRLQRELFLATHRLDLPFDWCDVYSVDDHGEETLVFGMNPQDGMAFAEDWSSGEPVDEQRAHYLATMAFRVVAEKAGVRDGDGLELGWRAGGSRTLEWTVTLPTENEKEAYLAFLGEVFSAVVQLNHEGCQLAVLELSINDAEGGPILRDVHDFELQSVASWYSSTDFMPPWINPPPGPTTVSMPPLDTAEAARVDAMGAADVVRTYMTTTDPAILLFLSAPRLQEETTAPNYVAEQRHEGDIANLVVKGPFAVFTDPGVYSREQWPIQEQFQVEYDLLVPRDDVVPAGPQLLFVYVGRMGEMSPWRILSLGTGP